MDYCKTRGNIRNTDKNNRISKSEIMTNVIEYFYKVINSSPRGSSKRYRSDFNQSAADL